MIPKSIKCSNSATQKGNHKGELPGFGRGFRFKGNLTVSGFRGVGV